MHHVGLGTFALSAAIVLAGCGSDGGTGSPNATNPASGTVGSVDKRLDADMQLVLNEVESLGAEPLEQLSVEEARKQPTYADAIQAILARRGQRMAYPTAVGAVQDVSLATAKGSIAARVYTPPTGTKPYPLVVYFHDGGFVVGSLDASDGVARSLASLAEAVVVSVDYRQAPENKFPAAHDDALAAYDWVTANAASYGANGARVAVAGEGAGGNLAANVAIAARAKGVAVPRHALLVDPIASADTSSPSYAEAPVPHAVDASTMVWFQNNYFRSPADGKDPRIDLLSATLAGFPPATIINAQLDPVRSDGEALATRLKAAGAVVNQRTYPGVVHGFFGLGIIVGDAADAMKFGAGELKNALR